METYEEILRRMEEVYEEESGHPAGDVTETGLRLRVLAGELYRLKAEIGWLARQAFPHTASGEWLDRHGAQRGVLRREAEKAKGVITFSRYLPLSFDAVIPKGTVCAVPGESPVEYETTEDAVLTAGELTVSAPAQAVAGGSAGNAAAGYINALVTPVAGVNYVTNGAAFTGGRDPEADEDYRPRVLEAYSLLPGGANVAFYRDIALSREGITAAGVVPRINGANTVGVYVWGEGAAPSPAAISGLQQELDRRREVGVTVSVQAAAAVAVNVTARIVPAAGTEFDRAQAAIEQALRSYLNSLTVGSAVYVTELTRVALEAAPVTELEFASTVHDIAGDPSRIPVAGTVRVEEIA